MEQWLTNKTKKRVIWEIQKILYDHPRYRADSENVQNKFSFDDRQQRGVIVNGTSADRVRLAADNYMGRLSSFVMMTHVGNAPMTTIEWVRENQPLLEQYSPKRDIFPSPPGVYILSVTKVPNESRKIPGEFVVEPILTVRNEMLIRFTSSADSEAQLSRDGLYPGSVRLWLDGRRPLRVGVDYIVDDEAGTVTFLKATPEGSLVYADYRYKTPVQGPFPFEMNAANLTAIPGSVLAFGDRPQACDKMAIVVTEDRSDVSEVYGGKFEVSFELTIFSRDAEDRELMSDYVVAKLLERSNQLGFEGIELVDIAPGGEAEEAYNAETDERFYDGSISLTLRVDWEYHLPLPVEVFRAETTSLESELQTGYLDGTAKPDGVRIVQNPLEIEGGRMTVGKGLSFERIT